MTTELKLFVLEAAEQSYCETNGIVVLAYDEKDARGIARAYDDNREFMSSRNWEHPTDITCKEHPLDSSCVVMTNDPTG